LVLSYAKNFAFFHNYRTGGTSIRRALKRFADEKRIRKPHTDPATVKNLIGSERFNRLFKFSFVRNPWDKMVSTYCYTRATPEHFEHQKVRNMSFNEFIKHVVAKEAKTQYQYLSDNSGLLLVDFVGRFERLEQDYKAVCKKIGLSVSLEHLNLVSHKPYKSYYDKESREIVKDYFKKDIETWGYSF
jgi:hypothetical protein